MGWIVKSGSNDQYLAVADNDYWEADDVTKEAILASESDAEPIRIYPHGAPAHVPGESYEFDLWARAMMIIPTPESSGALPEPPPSYRDALAEYPKQLKDGTTILY